MVDEDELYNCLVKRKFNSFLGLNYMPKNSTAAKLEYKRYCENTFDPVD